jgi:hypothetical protein
MQATSHSGYLTCNTSVPLTEQAPAETNTDIRLDWAFAAGRGFGPRGDLADELPLDDAEAPAAPEAKSSPMIAFRFQSGRSPATAFATRQQRRSDRDGRMRLLDRVPVRFPPPGE